MRERIGVKRSFVGLALGAALLGAGGPPADRFDTVVIDVARRLGTALHAGGVRVVLNRDADRFVSLEERTSLANDAKADLFVSIHANAARSRVPRGTETFFAALEASDAAAGEVAAREKQALASPPAPPRPRSPAP